MPYNNLARGNRDRRALPRKGRGPPRGEGDTGGAYSYAPLFVAPSRPRLTKSEPFRTVVRIAQHPLYGESVLGFLSAVLVVSAGLVMAAWMTLAAPVKSSAGTPTSPLAVKSAAESTPVASLGAPAAVSVAGAPLRFVLVPERSEVRYKVREQLANLSLPSDAIGVTRALSGAITLAPSGAVVREQSGIAVELRALHSDSSRRDAFLQRSTLDVNRFPAAELVPTEVRGLPSPLPTAGEVTFQLVGDLTVRGITRPTTWEATARIAGPEVAGSASTSFSFDDIGLTKPRVAAVLSVEDTIRLEIDFVFTRAPFSSP